MGIRKTKTSNICISLIPVINGEVSPMCIIPSNNAFLIMIKGRISPASSRAERKPAVSFSK
jgi:hypothetical protein